MGKGKALAGPQRILFATALDNLEQQHTRVLIAELRRMRVRASAQTPPIDSDCCTDCNDYERILFARATACAATYIQALKTELAKREHIPNKLEARRLRQEKARAARSR